MKLITYQGPATQDLGLIGISNSCFRFVSNILIVAFFVMVPVLTLGDIVVKNNATSTSIVRLLAHPDQYEGKKVQVVGAYARGHELQGLFLNSEDARSGNVQAGLWISFAGSETNRLVDSGLKGGLVKVVGTFHYDPREGVGHMGVWPGEIGSLELFQKVR